VFGQLTKALMSEPEDTKAIETAQAQVAPAVRAAGPTITRLKYALSARYGEKWRTRMPLPAVDEEVRAVIDASVGAVRERPS